MKVELTECNGLQTGLFWDLAKYERVTDWLKAIRDGLDDTRALDVTVTYGGTPHVFCVGGELSADAGKIIRAVSRLPKEARTIPNDRMEVVADVLEGKLHIVLNIVLR